MTNVNTLESGHLRFVRARDGTMIAYGDYGSGEPIILLHGLTETGESWHEAGYVEKLIHLGMRPITVDCRGHGRSGKPIEPHAYSGPNVAGDICAVMDTARIPRATLMGYSMGGMVALATALHHPERVSAIILIGAHPFAEDLGPFRDILDDGFAAWLAAVEAQVPDLSDSARARIISNDIDAIGACVANDRKDVSNVFSRLGIPTLAIYGDQDPRSGNTHRLAAITDVETLVLRERNHVTAFLAADDILSATASFLNRARARATVRGGL